MGRAPCCRVTPRQRALAAIAVVLVLVALVGIGVTAAGWEPVGPARLPALAQPDLQGAVDRGDFDVHGTHYRAYLLGSPGHYEAYVYRTGGEGGRIAAYEWEQGEVRDDGVLHVPLHGATSVALRTYRESWLGVWRTDPLTLQFNATA